MTFVDWSDPEAIVGMLTELVTDAHTEAQEETGEDVDARLDMLEALLIHLDAAVDNGAIDSQEGLLEHLRHGEEQIDARFDHDPVAVHLRHAIEELERMEHES